FDQNFIDASENVTIRMNKPTKLGPVIKADKPWEDFRLTSYFTVIQDGHMAKAYYSCFSVDQWHVDDAWENHAYLCYAESLDGVHWEKPNLGIVEFEGTKENNILMKSVVDGTVFIDPNAANEKRYKLLHTIGPHKGGLRVSYSADGIHFTTPDKPVIDWTPDSQQNAFWDDRIGKYVALLRGRPNMNIEYPGGEQRRLVVRKEFDDIEKPWDPSPPQVVFHADGDDHEELDFYTNAAINCPYAHDAYFMFPAAYHHFPPEMGNDGLLDSSIATSRDGIEWERPDRGPYISLGLQGEWDSNFIMVGVGLFQHDRKLYQYYSGVDLSHGGTRGKPLEERLRMRQWGWLGAVEQRLDGFFSADSAYTGGWLTTPRIVFEGARLELNIDCSAAGMAYVGIQDAEGQPIPGFTLEDADKIMGNDLAHTVTWGGKSDVSSLAGKPVRLHIDSRSTKLYAFQFRDGNSE
ncbi:MAG: hypothetical protein KC978_19100, partial [Candidatus Omnitrophica bacterium]|nr:hypothetical protein [Candidatus Omnitrophota bacterium]